MYVGVQQHPAGLAVSTVSLRMQAKVKATFMAISGDNLENKLSARQCTQPISPGDHKYKHTHVQCFITVTTIHIRSHAYAWLVMQILFFWLKINVWNIWWLSHQTECYWFCISVQHADCTWVFTIPKGFTSIYSLIYYFMTRCHIIIQYRQLILEHNIRKQQNTSRTCVSVNYQRHQ